MLFIVNPIAGRDRAIKLIPLIEEKMDKTNIKYKVSITSQPKEATSLTVKGLEEGYDSIIAVGGDGTINEVAMGIIQKGYGTLGIIPGGTGNDLARSLNIPLDPEEALYTLLGGEKKHIDYGRINGKFFLNVASIGLDADIVKRTEDVKKVIRGKIAYTIGLIITLMVYKSQKLIVELDNETMEIDAMLTAVANGKYYGGGMKICPMAVLDDGSFHIIIVKKVSKLKLLRFFPLVFKGTHVNLTDLVKVYSSKKVKLRFDKELLLNIDGDVIPVKDEVNFIIDEQKIEVYTNK
ncbi:diacylglycerol kinase family protein [Proteiniborus sp. DW1]|uniref:diacylglycerol/lipid kinase family protein n=1 Tax=Proteiniborus sp. DW1 TaxID=1889883 RepID=UPI000942E29C|nr:diacylglycerol kinase family protein [Proteiniborus sp. DW1]